MFVLKKEFWKKKKKKKEKIKIQKAEKITQEQDNWHDTKKKRKSNTIVVLLIAMNIFLSFDNSTNVIDCSNSKRKVTSESSYVIFVCLLRKGCFRFVPGEEIRIWG